MDRIKKHVSEIFPYWIITVMFLYGGPLFMFNDEIAVAIMGAMLPVACLVMGFVLGLKEGFSLIYTLMCLLAFIPQYWLNLPDLVAWAFYAFMYIGGGMIGMLVGWIVDKAVKKMMLG